MRDQLKSLTNMVNVMNQQQVCDADCQNKKNIENLRKTYVMAQQNVQMIRHPVGGCGPKDRHNKMCQRYDTL